MKVALTQATLLILLAVTAMAWQTGGVAARDLPKLDVNGMPGTATVFADNAGAIGMLMSILVWISSYTAYL